MAKKAKAVANIYQLKITLMHVEPAVWRRFQVKGNITLGRLHEITQVVMGWGNYHLHEFKVEGNRYGVPDVEGEVMFGAEVNNEKKFKLCDIAGQGDSFEYKYDFGDGWEHDIEVEKVSEPEPGVSYPKCLAGERACPPEDCGGPWGYEELLEILKNPKHREYRERREWAGGDFDPETFDLDAVNKALRRMR